MTYKALVAGCALVMAAGSFAAESSGRSAWIGVWNGELDGQPGVRLTLADDTGQLGGTVVFNLIKKENGQARVAGSDTHVLMHPHLEGSLLSFDVIRASDLKELQMRVRLVADGKAELHCVNCGEEAPIAPLTKAR